MEWDIVHRICRKAGPRLRRRKLARLFVAEG
jgi:hypothetical protein